MMRVAILLLAVLVAGCRNNPRDGGHLPDTPASGAAGVRPAPLGRVPDAYPPAGVQTGTATGGIPAPSSGTGNSEPNTRAVPVAPRAAPNIVPIRDIIASDRFVGSNVRVTGRCLGYGTLAVGGPPVTRSDWQLEQDGVAIYVSGERPPDCDSTRGATTFVTISARVAQDTLIGLPGQSSRPRRYLERTRE